VILGREGAGIVFKRPEISRHHCLLEVHDNYANLKDLDSTNGTFFEEERRARPRCCKMGRSSASATALSVSTLAPK